jgi:two-component system, LuxR family, response regulator FixJ
MNEIGPVHVVDDDDAMRDSLVFLLSTASIAAISHESAESLLAELSPHKCSCIVTDVRMPGMSGIDLLRHLQQTDKLIPVIVITGHSDVPLAVEALKAGAFDFIEKPFEDDRIISTVRAAMDTHTKARHDEGGRSAVLARLETLTARERQVFDGLVAGRPNKVIAYDLGISPRTVEIYRANVMTKLNASSLSEVVRIGFVANLDAATDFN